MFDSYDLFTTTVTNNDLLYDSVESVVASWLECLTPGSSGPGSGPGRGNCVVFLGTVVFFTPVVPFSTQVY